MIRSYRNKRGTLIVLAVAVLALAFSAAFAIGEVGVTAAAGMTFKEKKDGCDKALSTVGIDLAVGSRLEVIVTLKGKGGVGDLKLAGYDIDGLPKNALGDLCLRNCLSYLGIVQDYPGGVVFTIDEVNPEKVITNTMRRLAALGVMVHREPGARSLSFRANDIDYRAVFGAAPGGTLVYLGY